MKFTTQAPFASRRGLRLFRSSTPSGEGDRKPGASRFSPLLFLLLLLALPGGCQKSEPHADLVIANGMEPESIDPALITGLADMRVVGALFEGLTRLDPRTAEAIPGLAERWEISPDGRTYTFHLRTNLTWSTGESITSADVVFSWIRALDPVTASDYASQLYYIKNAEAFNAGTLKDPAQVGVQALDPLTVQVELNHPTAFFLDLCAFCTLNVVPRQAIVKNGDRWVVQQPVPVSGAYELVGWRLHDRIRVRKNPRYWDAANTKTAVVDFLPITSPSTALNLYETRGVDIVWDKDLVPTELLDILLKRPDFHTFPYLGIYFFRFNVNHKPFDNPKVRLALAMAIDKERITRKITRGGEVPAGNFTPPGIARYHPPAGLPYDPAQARRLLAEAGYPGGKGFPRFQYSFNAAEIHAKIAVEMQQMWRDELGIEMELKQMEWGVYLAEQTAVDFEISRSSWIGDYNDPETFLNLWMSNNGNNRTGWKNARYDQLLKEADEQTDLAKRESRLREAEEIVLREGVPAVPLYFYTGFNYYRENIKGVHANVLDMHPLNAIWKE